MKENSLIKQNVFALKRVLDRFPELYPYFEIKAIILKSDKKEFPFIVQVTSIQKEDQVALKKLPETENIRTYHETMKKEVFNDFLEMLFAHKVKIGGQVFNFYTQDQKKIRSW